MQRLILCFLAFGITLHSILVAPAAESPRPLFTEGYAGRLSYAPGEDAEFHISTSAAKFTVEIRRIGATNELVWSTKDLAGKEHPIPEDASSHGCRWPAALKVPVEVNWRSGYYMATLHAEDGGGAYTHRGRRTAERG